MIDALAVETCYERVVAMHIEGTRQGFIRQNLSGAMAYGSFCPAPLNDILPLNLTDDCLKTLTACSRKLGELAGMARFVPNIELYLTMYVCKEALLSAQIEGTQCTFDDVLDPHNSAAVHQEVSEVISYVSALESAVQHMDELPLCTRLLRITHALLLKNTRGADKSPGEIRTTQNWIGPAGCLLREAPYIPPNVEDMKQALSDLDSFINGAQEVDPIVKAALIHYQFETIHPFLDGNGRLGRLLITLSLIHDHVLPGAILYPSYELKRRRSEYYQHLTDVREHGRYEAWVHFFCSCLLASAEDAIASMDSLVSIHRWSEEAVRRNLGRSAANGLKLLELIERHPILDISLATAETGLSRSTVSSLLKAFCNVGILRLRDEGKQRYRIYQFDRYLDVLRNGADPI